MRDDAAARESWVRIGRDLRALRRLAGLTQAQLGLRVGYHHSLISRLEGGLREPPMGLLRRLDELFETGGALTAMLRSHPRGPSATSTPGFIALPGLEGTTLPGGGGTSEDLTLPTAWWPQRLPSHGQDCPLHGDCGCDLPTATETTDVLRCLMACDPTGLNPRLDPDAVHALSALLLAFERASVSSTPPGLAESLETVLRVVVAWARGTGGREPLRPAAVVLAGGYAQLAGRLRLHRGQRAMAMAWFGHGLRWAELADDATLRATLLTDVSTVARLDGDAESAVGYALAMAEVDGRRAWVRTLAQVYAARGYGLQGDTDRCTRAVGRARRELQRFTEPDRAAAPWLLGAEGDLRVESAVGGALRDLAVVTGDRAVARQAVAATRTSLQHVPALMRPTHLLLSLRLADALVCAGELDEAVAVAAAVVPDARGARRSTTREELDGLLRRMHRAGVAADAF